MTPFDAGSVCPKCQNGDIGTFYHKAGCSTCQRCHDSFECGGTSTPHMVRHCRRCHFEWFEAPLDVQVANVV